MFLVGTRRRALHCYVCFRLCLFSTEVGVPRKILFRVGTRRGLVYHHVCIQACSLLIGVEILVHVRRPGWLVGGAVHVGYKDTKRRKWAPVPTLYLHLHLSRESRYEFQIGCSKWRDIFPR